MCGILGVFGAPEHSARQTFIDMLRVQQNRGRDACGFAIISAQTSEYTPAKTKTTQIVHAKTLDELQNKIPAEVSSIIGHTLHAVVSLVPQPITRGTGILVANCEIYNWKEVARTHNLNADNDADLLLQLFDNLAKTAEFTPTAIRKILGQLNGVYAFGYIHGQTLVLTRDIMGEKPLFFAQVPATKNASTTMNSRKNEENTQDNPEAGRPSSFLFASESKTLRSVLVQNAVHIRELNPRHALLVDIKTMGCKSFTLPFFKKQRADLTDESTIVPELSGRLLQCVADRLPDPSVKVGVLFSGGVDSTLIALILKKLGRAFTCYTAAFEDEGLGKSADLAIARQAATELGFDLKTIVKDFGETQTLLKEVIPLIESSNVVKVGVALPFYACCKQAAADNVRVMFSGLGSEEIFAGYARHKTAADINAECISGLRKMYERDLYRDDVVSMNNTVELRLPFLDLELIKYALRISSDLKIPRPEKAENGEKNEDDEGTVQNIQSKYILRKAALALGLPQAYALRPKQAAQYGSRFDKAIQKLASRNGFELKSAYLNTFFPPKNQRLAVLFSSGKDSMYALYTMKRQEYPISCLITLKSANPDSYMFHTPAIDLAAMQAKALDIPIIIQQTAGEKEAELNDLKKAIQKAVKKYHIDGIITGALYSVYQRERIEIIAEELGIKVFSPLWHIDQEKELRQILDAGFIVILTQTAAEGLDGSWLGRPLTQADVDRLVQLHHKLGINVAGEGGEFESLVIDGPKELFSAKIEVLNSEIRRDGGKYTLQIHTAELTPK